MVMKLHALVVLVMLTGLIGVNVWWMKNESSKTSTWSKEAQHGRAAELQKTKHVYLSNPHCLELHAKNESHSHIDEHVCLHNGIHGHMNSSMLITLFLVPSNKATADSLHELLSQYHQLNVNVVVTSQSCSLLVLASSIGFPTLRLSDTSDISALTYKHVFKLADQNTETRVVGLAFGDVAFDLSLDMTIKALLNEIAGGTMRKFIASATTTRSTTAEEFPKKKKKRRRLISSPDVFFFPKNFGIDWETQLPEFLIGGGQFGRWFLKYCMMNAGPVIDCSATMKVEQFLSHPRDYLLQSPSNDLQTAVEEINDLIYEANHQIDVLGSGWMTKINNNGRIEVEKTG